jgi:hypothetical protein
MRFSVLVSLPALAFSAVCVAATDISYDSGIDYCLIKNAVALGKDNQEDAGTVVEAAMSKCGDAIEAASQMASLFVITSKAARENDRYYGRRSTDPYPTATSEASLIARWKEAARGKAIAALIEARAASKAAP